jgi:hypothetical protein
VVFSLEHDIKVTKNHQNLLPTQTLIVAYMVVMYEGHPESKVTRAPEAGGNFLFEVGHLACRGDPSCQFVWSCVFVGHFVKSQ